MERIKLLWDAWEDCLCKEQLRTEFDRLKREIEEANIVKEQYWKMAVNEARDANEAQAENERLKKVNTGLVKGFDKACDQRDTLQSWLDKISEFIAGVDREMLREQLKMYRVCNYPYGYNVTGVVERIITYLGSQKSGEKVNHIHSDDSGVFWKGREEDCPTCNPKHLCNDGIWEYIPKSECQRCNPPKCGHKNLGPLALGGTQRCLDCHEWLIAKPLTQCPECGGTRQKKQCYPVNKDDRLGLTYCVYERCPRCHESGVI